MKFAQPLPQFGDEYDGIKLRALVQILESDVPSSKNKAVAHATANYDVQSGVENVVGDATAAAFAVTLPPPAANYNRRVSVIRTNAGANAVNVLGTGPQFPRALSAQYQAIIVISDGVNWFIIGTA